MSWLSLFFLSGPPIRGKGPSNFGYGNLEAQLLLHEDDVDSVRHVLPVEGQHLADEAVLTVGQPRPGIFQRQGILLHPAHRVLQGWHDLLAADDPDDLTCARSVGTELA